MFIRMKQYLFQLCSQSQSKFKLDKNVCSLGDLDLDTLLPKGITSSHYLPKEAEPPWESFRRPLSDLSADENTERQSSKLSTGAGFRWAPTSPCSQILTATTGSPVPNLHSMRTTAKPCTEIKALSHYKHPLLPACQDGCLQTRSYLDVLSRFSFFPSYFKGFSNMFRQKAKRILFPCLLHSQTHSGAVFLLLSKLFTESSRMITTIRALKTLKTTILPRTPF